MIYGFSPVGALGILVHVEVDIRRGLPGTDVVGLPSSEVREARDRVRVAIRNSGYEYPVDRILINLSPADVPKVGSGFDLPIALAILQQSGQVKLPERLLATGELSVRGEIVPVRGTLSAILSADDHEVGTVILGERALRHIGSHIAGTPEIRYASSLRELRSHGLRSAPPRFDDETEHRDSLSLDDIVGQPALKWSAAVAAAGFHNLLLMGPPGSGKTMAARRVSTLLPDLSRPAGREVARIYSMRGLEGSLRRNRPPVRIPHHSASVEGMLGGGKGNLPGEVSLAHNGIMVLDEATEFRPRVLQALREPVERRHVSISRAGRSEEFPARFQLLLTSNLCPCGKLGQPEARCMCSMQEIERYWRRLGAALLDRVDIRVRTYYQDTPAPTPPHMDLAHQISRAIQRQESRGQGSPWIRNGLIPPEAVSRLLPLTSALERLLRRRMQQLSLSERAAASVRAVARTLADLSDRDDVTAEDILEAAALRSPGPV
ncbi:MAG TPA: YifB family Mg chelatase-like AAA ATPase [Alkalispirochaeta sp.]|nr:YifB family Mg chelatase-like AAA ATPase [Alkalispirochaeta sp.]